MAAASRDTSASGTTTIPAICATPISGMARKFSASPAKVTREKVSAPIGKRSASAATEAANIAKSDRLNAEIAETAEPIAFSARSADSAFHFVITGTTTRMASVAPQVRTNAGSATLSGSAATRSAATSARAFSGGLR